MSHLQEVKLREKTMKEKKKGEVTLSHLLLSLPAAAVGRAQIVEDHGNAF